ncbi:Peptidyl-prolyl cis-trans isomerase-like 4 [Coemansia aciculifera]|uniref:Peptidyl-prolyl cis-trans isomerase n=1 Tax=Coemansia aciculifera TaxID=417176 RepID=A0A9W8IR12_9FUNG|nr:Peptidyl-prolyl cis-trans isomerase-like 4 [Coemansia aciculifera]KAJ2875157.1 Peptidyl-prolyl cis-trans isomerase-like 4 [Coemansia aciculifera]
MSVLVETSIGDLVIDLYTAEAPRTSMNFLKLCKTKYYNFVSFHRIERGFIAQTGDPTGTGTGGQSVYGVLGGAPYFPAEIHPKLKHKKRGTVSMAVSGEEPGVSGSQFFITLADDLDYLDGRYTVFGHVTEGLDILDQINLALCDSKHRPLRDILIRHTIVLDDPFPDPPSLVVPQSPLLPTSEQLSEIRMEAGSDHENQPSESESAKREREANAQALTLEMIGDLPFADIKPPENILFVCKLNPVTRDDDLETIFTRFGKILSCQVIRDSLSGDSLGYAFIEFDQKEACEEAYFKMDNVLIDDRRIHVDFSQSVSKLHGKWMQSRVQGKTLKMKSRYRDEAASNRADEKTFDMVFDTSAGRSEDRRRRRDNNSDRRRSRSPSRQRQVSQK